MIEFNFNISKKVRQTMIMQLATSQASSSFSSIQICDSCKIMNKVIRNLNLKKHSFEKRLQIFEDEVFSSQQIISNYQNEILQLQAA